MRQKFVAPPPPDNNYKAFLGVICEHIQRARLAASASVNREVLLLNYRVGQEINKRREEKGWGAKVVDDLARDLKSAGYKGFGQANLHAMALFATEYSEEEIVQPRLDNLGWASHMILMQNCKDKDTRFWYMERASANGWSKRDLEAHIHTQLHLRQGKALNNFENTLPAPQSDMAQDLIKSEYNFEHLALNEESKERHLEAQLLSDVCKMLQELGKGFALVDQQYHFSEGEQDFYIDLLFYHTKMHCYVVVELKTKPFTPEFAGKLGFYVSSVDDLERSEEDNPTIGLLLCPNYNEV